MVSAVGRVEALLVGWLVWCQWCATYISRDLREGEARTGRTTMLAPLLAASATFSPARKRFAALSFPVPYQSLPPPLSLPAGVSSLTSRQLNQRELARLFQRRGHDRCCGGFERCGGGGKEAAEHSQMTVDVRACAGLSQDNKWSGSGSGSGSGLYIHPDCIYLFVYFGSFRCPLLCLPLTKLSTRVTHLACEGSIKEVWDTQSVQVYHDSEVLSLAQIMSSGTYMYP